MRWMLKRGNAVLFIGSVSIIKNKPYFSSASVTNDVSGLSGSITKCTSIIS